MAMDIFASLSSDYVPSGLVGGALLAAGMCFTLIYILALATILVCHMEEP